MAIEFKLKKRAWTCELNIWSIIWTMPYIPWWKSPGLVLYPRFIAMWNGTLRECLIGEFWTILKQRTNLIFQAKIQFLWMLLQGKSKYTRTRDHNITSKLLAKSLKFGYNKRWTNKQQRTRNVNWWMCERECEQASMNRKKYSN